MSPREAAEIAGFEMIKKENLPVVLQSALLGAFMGLVAYFGKTIDERTQKLGDAIEKRALEVRSAIDAHERLPSHRESQEWKRYTEEAIKALKENQGKIQTDLSSLRLNMQAVLSAVSEQK